MTDKDLIKFQGFYTVMGIRLFQENRSLSKSPKDLILYYFYKTFFVPIKNIKNFVSVLLKNVK